MKKDKDDIESKKIKEDLADYFSQSEVLSDEPKIPGINKKIPPLSSTIQNENNLLKAVNEFSDRYNVDNRRSLSNKKFIISFEDLMSLIKDTILYQKKIFEVINFEKNKIKEITKDFINNLSYTIFSFERIDIPENKHENLTNSIIRINRKTLDSPIYSSTESNYPSKKIINFSPSNYLKVNENQTMKVKKKYDLEKTDRKDFINTLQNTGNKKNFNNINTQVVVKRLSTPKKIKTPYKRNKSKIIKSTYKKKLNEDFTTENINNESSSPNTVTKRKNIGTSSKLKIQTTNYSINNFQKKDTNNIFNINLLKNNSVVLRSKTAKKNKIVKNQEKEKSNKKIYSNIIDALKNCNFYFEDKKFKSSKNVSSTPKLTKYSIIKTQIISNVPKPSVMTNKMLECSRKYIDDFNGIKEQEKEKEREKEKKYSAKRK